MKTKIQLAAAAMLMSFSTISFALDQSWSLVPLYETYNGSYTDTFLTTSS
jgi:hypothetical protein